MAIDDPILQFGMATPSESNGAGRRFLESNHTDAIRSPLWLFDDTAIEYLDVPILLSRRYDGGDIVVTVPVSERSANASKQFRFEAAFFRLEADAVDFDSTSHTFSYRGVSFSHPSAIGEIVYPEITFTSSQIDGLLAGESGYLRFRRNPTHTDDDATGDAEVWEYFLSAREA